MSDLPPGASIELIEEELGFQLALLNSLDPDDPEYLTKKDAFEQIIEDLEQRLAGTPEKAVQRPGTPRQDTVSPTELRFGQAFDLPSRENEVSVGAQPVESPLASRAQRNLPSLQSQASVPSSAEPSHAATSSKRNQGAAGLVDLNLQQASRKSQKTSRASSPGSLDSWEQAERDLERQSGLRLGGGRQETLKKWQERQRLQEERIKREHEDAALARQLSSETYAGPASHAYERPTQAMLRANGNSFGFSRPVAPQPVLPPPVPAAPASVPEFNPFGGYDFGVGQDGFSGFAGPGYSTQESNEAMPEIKDEVATLQQPSQLPYEFEDPPYRERYLDSDSDELQEISSSQFVSNQNTRRSRKPLIPMSAIPDTQPYSNYSTTQSNFAQPGGSNLAFSRPQGSGFNSSYNLVNGVYDLTSSAFNAGYDWLQSTMNNFSSTMPTGNTYNNMPGIQPPSDFFSTGQGIGEMYTNPAFSEFMPASSYNSNPFAPRDLDAEIRNRGLGFMLADPTRTREELEQLVDNIRPDEDIPPEMRAGTPKELKFGLMEHQKLGLAWLISQEEGSNKGAILADDMGLGKTLQALALMVSRPSQDPARKTTLIVAPVALLRQWEGEIDSKLNNGHKLKVAIYRGQKKSLSTFAQLSKYDVVLVTYGMLASEWKKAFERESSRYIHQPSPLFGQHAKWYRVILDEAQYIKNHNSKSAKAAAHLDATYRLCMTGTPMMNGVHELYSLIHFLKIPPYSHLDTFNSTFRRPLQAQNERGRTKAMRTLQILLKAILLRRTKKSEIDGKPILQLPEKVVEITHAVFDPDQEAYYRAIETAMQLEVNRFLASTKIRDYSQILVRLLRLRQACCHPHLIENFAEQGETNVSAEDMTSLAKELDAVVISRIKNAEGAFECPVCLDAVENPIIFFPCGHDMCSECLARLLDPNNMIGRGLDSVDAKCPECRGRIDPKRVLNYATFEQVHLPEEYAKKHPEAAEDRDGADADSDSDSEDEESDDDSDADSQGDLRDFIVPDTADGEDEDEEQEEEAEEQLDGEEDADYVKVENPETDEGEPKKDSGRKGKAKVSDKGKGKARRKSKAKRKGKGKGKGKKTEKKKKTLADLRKEGLRNAKAKKVYLRKLRKRWETSAKVDKVMEILRDIRDNDVGEKTIIFSQFTTFLDLLEVPIGDAQWSYRRYDGSMTANARNDAVYDFMQKQEVTVMLCSLKAGNAGLNLTAASQVIILDPFWNPYIEEQAIDRAYRIGQTRPVKVHKVLVQNTVEDRIVQIQDRKRELISEALDEKTGQSLSRLGRQELRYLFGLSSNLPGGPATVGETMAEDLGM